MLCRIFGITAIFTIINVTVMAVVASMPPIVEVVNGTLRGIVLPETGVERFLGIPYAQPPVGQLRFRHPVAYSNKWQGVRDATKFAEACPGYAGFSAGLPMSEDCLTLNVIRPPNTLQNAGLPVLVWIHGGGYTGGSSRDPRYDLSNMVHASSLMGKPIITVSINYRLAAFGFLAAAELDELNFGLYDQRKALNWVQSNIASFGGDPSKVTIWGESAGAFSVGYHTISYDGNHDGLFRAAIFESGSALIPSIQPVHGGDYQKHFDNISETVGCSHVSDPVECLRSAPYEKLFTASAPFVFSPVIDGRIIPRFPSESFQMNLVANISILAGANMDEGTASFWGPRGTLNTTADVAAFVESLGLGLPQSVVDTVLSLYPDIPSEGCPYNTGNERFADQGYQYKRGAAIAGDVFIHAGRRAVADYHTKVNNGTNRTVWSYLFNQNPWNGIEELIATVQPVNVTHFTEIGYVFNNSNADLTTWIGSDPDSHILSGLMSRSWISFVHDLDPNNHGLSDVAIWPDYRFDPSIIVFAAGKTHIEKDNYRTPQLAFWGKIWRLLLT